MILYTNDDNIDSRIIKKAVEALKDGALIAYPTDSCWGIGCSTTSKIALEKLRKLKKDFKNYTPTLICSEISQITLVAELNNRNFKFIKKYVPGPYVFILPALDSVEKTINQKRVEVGIRIPSVSIPRKIVEELGYPIFSVSASRKMADKSLWDDAYAEENLFVSGWELEDIHEIEFIIDAGEELPKRLTTVVDLSGDDIEIKRQGIGAL
ncbi:MAG: threonylcarbamoyl-AMP synthase [Spirochaetes bacterium]|nr:threonylcarbamoyl-AMP synthase [Spirochaetota bacterium]